MHVFELLNLFVDHINIFLHIEFALAAIVIHVSDLSKYWSLLPSLHAVATVETVMLHLLRRNAAVGASMVSRLLAIMFPT